MKTKSLICLLVLAVFCSGLQAQISVATLAQLRNAADTSDYLYTGNADITYYDASLHHYFIQDETAAIMADDYSTYLSAGFIRGAGITGILGNLSDYENNVWFLLKADATASSPIGILPQSMSVMEFISQGDDIESELVTLQDVYFTAADSSTVFETGTRYDLQSSPGGSVIECYTRFQLANYIGAVIPGIAINITGLVTESSGNYYITPRDSADFEFVETEKHVQFNVDMSESGMMEGDQVYVTGDFVGWSMPGDMAELALTDPDEDNIYSVSIVTEQNRIEYKYFLNAGWEGGEWSEEDNRIAYLDGDMTLNDVWGDTSNIYVEMSGPLGGGAGTQEDPWLIYTAEHLDSVRYYCSTWEDGSLSHFLLMNDLDLGVSPWADGSGWDPIGNTDTPFMGYFFGNGHKILNMAIDDDSDAYMGLFGHNRGYIGDLFVHDALILRGNGRAGILAGVNKDSGTIERCDVSGEMLDAGAVGKMGGLTSWNQGSITYCSSHVTITCDGGTCIAGLAAQNPGGILMHSESHGTLNCSSCSYVGGIAGKVWYNTQLSGCFSDMAINAGNSWNVGGIAGSIEGSILSTSYYNNFHDDIIAYSSAGGLAGFVRSSSVWDCYSVGNVRCEQRAGGLLGLSSGSQIQHCYATGEITKCFNNAGGLIGYEHGGSVSDCFWDMELSRIERSAGGRGLNTEDMLSAVTYSGWAMDVTWHMGETSYPFLSPQTEPAVWNFPRGDDGLYQLMVTVDMADAEGFDPTLDNVYISGSFAGWPEPASSDTYRMTRYSDNASMWYAALDVPDGSYDYKFFINSGWDGGEWTGDPNRCMTVHDYTLVNDVWNVLPDTVSSDLVYASSVIGYSSQITDSSLFEGAWHAEQVLGAPDSYPAYDNKTGLVWLSETPDAEREYLELGLPESGFAYGLFVYETYMPGTIDSVSVRSAEDGTWECVWTGNPGFAGPVSRIFPVMFDKTSYLVDAVRLDMNSSAIGDSWNETDAVAVALSDTSGLGNDWGINIAAYWNSYQDIENYLGGSIAATDGFDVEIDEVEAPPAPGEYVSCYFPHPEWANLLGDNFAVDIRELKFNSTQTWDFEVLNTDTGLTTLNFSGENVNANSVTLKDKTTGMEMELSEGFVYEFTALADIAREFSITVGDTTAEDTTVVDTIPAQLTISQNCSGPAILVSGEELEISWQIEHDFDLSMVIIGLSEDGGDYMFVDSVGAVSSYTWTIPDRDISQTCLLKIGAVDTDGEIITAESSEPFAIGGSHLFRNVVAGWTLFGFPCEIEMPAEEESQRLVLPYVVLYEYVNGGYQIPYMHHLGSGYWLGTSESLLTGLEGEIQRENVTADLEQGWNMISDPLITDVAADSLIFRHNGDTKLYAAAKAAGWINELYAYDAGLGYFMADNLEPWNGYWISVLNTGMTVEYPLHKRRDVRIRKASVETPLLALHAQGNMLRNDLLKLDVNESATDGFDMEFDAVCPPASPSSDYLRLFVEHSNVNFILGNKFVQDVRSPATQDSYREWCIKVESSESDVSLSWDLGEIPQGQQLAVDRTGNGIYEDLSLLNNFTVSDGDQLIIRLGVSVVGVQEATIPAEYELSANYPNPFNPVTTIDYGLPEAGFVDISIYDLNGRKIATLINQQQPAGQYSVRWDGCNSGGFKVGSGMYIYRLQSKETVLSNKMLLMK